MILITLSVTENDGDVLEKWDGFEQNKSVHLGLSSSLWSFSEILLSLLYIYSDFLYLKSISWWPIVMSLRMPRVSVVFPIKFEF